MSKVAEFFREVARLSPVIPFTSERTRRIHRIGPISAFSTISSFDLINQGGASKPIKAISIRATGTLTTNGTSGTATDTMPALAFGTTVRLSGSHKDLGEVIVYDGDGIDLYHLSSYLSHAAKEISGTLATNATHTISWDIPLYHPEHARQGVFSYLDPREFSNLQLTITGGADSSFGYTNVPTAIASLTYDVVVVEDMTPPPVNYPHYIPMIKSLREATTSANLQQRTGGLAGAFLALIYLRTHDDSASGDSERVNGLLRTVRVNHRGQYVIDLTNFESLREITNRRWRQSWVTTRPAGIVILDADEDNDPDNMWDTRVQPIYMDYDTSSTPPAGTTAVTVTTSDYVQAHALGFAPNRSLAEALQTMSGVAAEDDA